MAQGRDNNAIIPNDIVEFSVGAGRLPVKNYSGNPVELAEFLMNCNHMADSNGYNEALANQRLPIYLTGMARSVFMNMAAKQTWIQVVKEMSKGLIIGDVGRMLRQQFQQWKLRPGELIGEFANQLEISEKKAFGAQANWTAQIKELIQDQFRYGMRKRSFVESLLL